MRETTYLRYQPERFTQISTHVPRAGDDLLPAYRVSHVRYFNPRPPCGRRLSSPFHFFNFLLFQPTSPVRETTDILMLRRLPLKFQPTSPVRETTVCRRSVCNQVIAISTHVPRAGDDRQSPHRLDTTTYFNPRPPCGRRHRDAQAQWSLVISTHVPRAGDDRLDVPKANYLNEFQPTSPVRETTPANGQRYTGRAISTHVPRAGDDRL